MRKGRLQLSPDQLLVMATEMTNVIPITRQRNTVAEAIDEIRSDAPDLLIAFTMKDGKFLITSSRGKFSCTRSERNPAYSGCYAYGYAATGSQTDYDRTRRYSIATPERTACAH